jgi:hypothetical protein
MSKPKKSATFSWLMLAAVLVPLVAVAIVIFLSQESRSSLPKFYEKTSLPSSFHLEKKQNIKPGPVEGRPLPVEWRYAYTTSESIEQAKRSLTDTFVNAGYTRKDEALDNILFSYDKDEPKDLGHIELRVVVYRDAGQTKVTVNVSGMEMG